ncbi:MAG: hypothetical protein GF384_03280 [Elusimicrobia bacterium]|nr:hypothetical protein [Elusimicrobiota bacterium]
MNKKNINHKCGNNRGWTYVEIVVASVVFVIGIFPIMKLLDGILTGISNRNNTLTANYYAQNILEIIKHKRWDENAPGPRSYTTNYSVTLGPEGGETYPDFDDIDDFNGFTMKNEKYFECLVDVDYVNVPTDGSPVTVAPTGSTTDFKQISITVQWINQYDKDIVVKTIMANGM